jgi:hypothetical protein
MLKPALLILAAVASVASAHATDLTSCRTQATIAADEWVKGNLISGSEASQMEPAPLIIIAYGHKYGVARNVMDQETLRPRMLGTLISERQEVYKEELDRCLGHFTVKILPGKPDAVKRLTKSAPWPETIR